MDALFGSLARLLSELIAYEWLAVSVHRGDSLHTWLHQRIEDRLTAMVRAGFLDEVRRLRARGDLQADLPSMRCVGYRQAWQALERGGDAPWQPEAVAATRQLAKRQLTWLRSISSRQVVACDQAEAQDEALRTLMALALHRGRTLAIG
jgi:tRNA dimethylallyltransferase